jgi:hypothetical protein
MAAEVPPTDFFVAGGTLNAEAPSYAKRPADDELFELASSGQFCYVLTPRQMGKSSLMIRIARRLADQGIRAAVVDLTQIGVDATAEQWYLGLLSQLKRSLRLSVDPTAWWQERGALSPAQRFTDFLRDVVLTEIQARVVIFIDEIYVSDICQDTLTTLAGAREQCGVVRLRLGDVLLDHALPAADDSTDGGHGQALLEQFTYPLVVLQVAFDAFQAMAGLAGDVGRRQPLLEQADDLGLVRGPAALIHLVALEQ